MTSKLNHTGILTNDLLEDRRIDDVINLYYSKQVNFVLPCVCSVIDHSRRKKCSQNISDTLGYHLLWLPHFDVICDLLLIKRTAT